VFCQCGHEYGSHNLDGRCGVVEEVVQYFPSRCECVSYVQINPLEHLVNGTAICARYGVAKSTLSGWQTRNGFPKPLDAPGLIGVKVWDCAEVEKWHDNWMVGRR